jgi:hypothetical protein
MSETRTLLAKISALRQRLEQAQGLANEARSAAAALLSLQGTAPDAGPEAALRELDEGGLALDYVVGAFADNEPGNSPKQLTSRARRVLERGRELLGQLRSLSDSLALNAASEDGPAPLVYLYRDTVAMIDTALRTVSLLPESVTAQMHLCRGLEVTIEEVADRLRTISHGCERLDRGDEQVALLSSLLITV